MADYINLDEIHTPADGALVPAAWGHGIRQDFDALHSPYSMWLVRNEYDMYDGALISSGSVVVIDFNTVVSHSGEFFTQTDNAVNSFTVPADGYYFASLTTIISASPYDGTDTMFAALMFKDDTDDSHYLLRQSQHIGNPYLSMSGIVRLQAGTSLSFVAYQDSGSDAYMPVGTNAKLVYLGRKL